MKKSIAIVAALVAGCSSSSSSAPPPASSSVVGSCPVAGSYSVTSTTLNGTCGDWGGARVYKVSIDGSTITLDPGLGSPTTVDGVQFDTSACTLTGAVKIPLSAAASSCTTEEDHGFTLTFTASGFTGNELDQGTVCVPGDGGKSPCLASYSLTGTRE